MAKIQGSVIDAGKNPLPNAIVSFQQSAGVDSDKVKTDDKGTYITKTLKAGDYQWEARLKGFVASTGVLKGVKDDDKTLKMKPILLQRAGGLSGRVLDPAAHGVPGVEILASTQTEKLGPVVSNADGVFAFSDLSPGKYKVAVQAPPGFQDPDPQDVPVEAGKNTDNVDFHLVAVVVVAPGSISGTLKDLAGKGISDVTVNATNQANPAISANAKTQAGGGYGIAGLPAGMYAIDVTAPPGFLTPKPVANVNVQPGNDTGNVDFLLQRCSISGRVVGLTAGAQAGVAAIDVNNKIVGAPAVADAAGNYSIPDLPKGIYTVMVQNHPEYIPAYNVEAIDVETSGIDFMLDPVDDFVGRLDDARFSIESAFNIDEADQAISLFSVVTLMLAGLAKFKKGEEETIDVLGISSLYYGLQDGSLRGKIVVENPQEVWRIIEQDLKSLAQRLNDSQSDIQFLIQEGRRQFALAWNSNGGGEANFRFPQLWKRYVEIGNHPLLSLNIREEEKGRMADPHRISEFFGLLRELKSVLIQIVRSLSKYGTAATKRANEEWSDFETRAGEIIATISQYRITPDQIRRNHWSVLADLTNKNRETEIVPYVVLARQGGKLLRYAMSIVLQCGREIDRIDDDHLRDLFQPRSDAPAFWTERIRKESSVLKQYPLKSWV